MARMRFQTPPVTPQAPPRRRFGRPTEPAETTRSWVESSWMLRDGLDVQELDEIDSRPSGWPEDAIPRRS
jgi:hypothetical protein